MADRPLADKSPCALVCCKGNVCFFYQVQYQSVAPFGRPVHSDTDSIFFGKHSSHATITARRGFTYIFRQRSIAMYSFIQLSELGRRKENKNAQASKQYQRGIRTRVLSFASPAFYRAAEGHYLPELQQKQKRHAGGDSINKS